MLLTAALLGLTPFARADLILTWTGNTSSNVLLSGNWTSTPLGDDDVVFGVPSGNRYTIFLPSNDPAISFHDVTFNGASRGVYTFTGQNSVVGLTGNVDIQTSGNVLFSNDVNTLGIQLSSGTHSVTVTPSDTTLQIDGVVSDSSDAYVAKYGAGTLILNGQNTFHGLSVYEGKVVAGASSDSGITSGSLGAGWLKFYDGSTLSHTSALTILYNNLDLDCRSDTTVIFESTSGKTLDLRGQITGDAEIVKTGLGTLVLANGSNSNTGGVDVQAGTLQVAATSDLEMNQGPIGWGDLKLHDGTTLQKEESVGDVTLYNDIVLSGSNVNIDTEQSSALALLGTISGTASLTKLDTGYLLLAGRDGGSYAEYSESDFSGGVNVQAGTLILGSSSYVADGVYLFGPVGSGTLTMQGGTALRTAAGAGEITLHNDISLASGSVTIGSDHGTLNLHGDIGGSGKLVKDGTQDLYLDGNNSFSGGVYLTAGNIVFDSNTAAGTGAVEIANTGTLHAYFNSAAPTIAGLKGGSSSATVDLGSESHTNLTIDQAGNTTYAGVFSGGASNAITKTGVGTLTLTGDSSSTYGGKWTINGGTLAVGSGALGGTPASVVADSITLNGGTLRSTANATLDANRGVTIGNNGGTVEIDGATTAVYNGIVSGTGVTSSFTKTGAGTLELGGASTFAGGTSHNAGALLLGASSSGSARSATSGPVGTGTLKLKNGSVLGLGASATAITLHNDVALDTSAGSAAIDIAGSSNSLTIEGVVSGTAGIAKNNAGALVLKNSNTFTGSLTINGGKVDLYSDSAAGAGTLAFGGNAYARFFTTSPTIKGLASTSGATNAETMIANNSAATLTIDQAANTTYYGDLRADGAGTDGKFIKTGVGTLTLNGSTIYGHTGQGTTHDLLEVQNGVLELSGVAFEASTTSVRVNGGALRVAGGTMLANPVVAGANGGDIAGNGTITGAITMNAGLNFAPGGGDLTVNGVISGTAPLTKTGAGRLILGGNNTYSGGTSIQAGSIKVNHNNALGTGTVSLAGGSLEVGNGITLGNALNFSSGTTVLGGTGTFNTAITADSHVVLSPGNSPGTLHFGAGLTLASGGAISFQVQDAAGGAGTGWDSLDVVGGLVLTAATNTITFNVTFLNSGGTDGLPSNFNSASDYSWTVATSATPIVGFSADQFHIVTDGASLPYGFVVDKSTDNLSLLVKYSPSFAPVPEPSTYALLGLGFASLGLRYWRRRRVQG